MTLAIGRDSHVETRLVVECASADAATIEVRGTRVTTGRLVLQPSFEVEVPVVGVESIALVQAEIAIEGRAEVVLQAEVAELAATANAPHSPDLPACR